MHIPLSLAPSPQNAPQEHKFADVIGVVIRHLQSFPNEILSVAVGEWRKKIRVPICDEVPHLLIVRAERIHAAVPRLRVGGFGG